MTATPLVRNALFALALLMGSAQLASAQAITATMDDNTALATKKNPGDPINYTVQINSPGVSNATNVQFTDRIGLVEIYNLK